jgi:uncharacterized protein with ParB-like and HNH nuclease domain
MKFSDIPQFVSSGSYEINMPLGYLEKTIQNWIEDHGYGLQLNPDFQRGHVWTEQQQISFVEYFFRGGRSGMVIYFNKPSWDRPATTDYDDFVCVDGLQRITALRRFLSNEIPIFDTFYLQFEDNLRIARSCDRLRINVNTLQTKAEVLEWYLQMNTGGTIHTDQEILKVKSMLKSELERKK